MQETQETWVRSLGGENPWERKWKPTPVFLLEHSMDRGAWWATVQGVTKSQTWLNTYTHTHTHTHTYSCCRPSGFRGCGAWALLPPSMCDLPRPEIEPTSPALQDEFLTTGSPREVQRSCSFWGVNSPMKNAPKFNVNDRLSLDYGIVIISQFNSV